MQTGKEVCLAMLLSQVWLMQRLDPGHVVLEQRHQGGGEGRQSTDRGTITNQAGIWPL
jgi:hypothetical protein